MGTDVNRVLQVPMFSFLPVACLDIFSFFSVTFPVHLFAQVSGSSFKLVASRFRNIIVVAGDCEIVKKRKISISEIRGSNGYHLVENVVRNFREKFTILHDTIAPKLS